MAYILFTRVLIELARCAQSSSNLNEIVYIKKARKFISENFEQDITVSMVANEVGINSAYLQTLFKKHYGCGIMTYTNKLRFDKSEFLLKNTKMSITDIAFKVGFNNRQNFGLAFTKAYSMSPNQFRKLVCCNIEIET